MVHEGLSQRIGLDLTHYQVSVVRHHASCELKDTELQRDCREYGSLGRSVMTCAYVTYLFVEEGVRDKGVLSKRLDAFIDYATKVTYERLSLEDFAIVGPSDSVGNAHDDITLRLIAAIYISHGFMAAYSFLEPCFFDAPKAAGGEYKQIVQRYAQERRMPFSYTIVDRTGPDNAPRYTCELIVGSERTLGISVGKKRAEVEAAKSFVRKHGIETGKGDRASRPKSRGLPISKARLRQLSNALRVIRMGDGLLTLHQMDEALTHISYTEGKPSVTSNDEFRVIGTRVLDMLANEYVYKNYVSEYIEARQAAAVLISEERLGKILPDSLLASLRRGNGPETRVLGSTDSAKADVLRAVLAQLWISYYLKGDEKLAAAARTIAGFVVDEKDGTQPISYTSIVQNLVQAYGYKWGYESKGGRGPLHEPVYLQETIIMGKGMVARATGTGRTIKAARSDANKKVLDSLLASCPDDERSRKMRTMMQPLHSLLRHRDGTARAFITPDMLESGHDPRDCALEVDEAYDTVMDGGVLVKAASQLTIENQSKETNVGLRVEEASEESIDEPRLQGAPDEVNAIPKAPDVTNAESQGLEPSSAASNAEVDLTFLPERNAEVLYVCRDSYDCVKRGHKTEGCRWELKSLGDNKVGIDAERCADCGVTLTNYDNYRVIRDKDGPLLGRYVIVERWRARKPDYLISLVGPTLALYGYGVSAALGLTNGERRRILANALMNGAVTEAEAKKYLVFCIGRNENQCCMAQAVERWRSDLAWLLAGEANYVHRGELPFENQS